jgi:hypothetical protein
MNRIPVANVVGARVSGSVKFGGAPLGFKDKGVVFGSSAGVAIVSEKLPRGSSHREMSDNMRDTEKAITKYKSYARTFYIEMQVRK